MYFKICGLLVNLTEKSASNRRKILNVKVNYCSIEDEPSASGDASAETRRTLSADGEKLTTLEALARLFIRHESRARAVDEELDRELLEEVPEDAEGGGGDDADEEDDDDPTSSGRLQRPPDAGIDAAEVVTALNSAMLRAKNHMLDSMVASYVALLLGCLINTDEV